jgi:AmmeMemoRadiSam system protein B
MSEDYPKLRPVEAIPAQENMICLRDPQGFSDKILLLQPEAFFIITLFDGRHSILDIQTAYTRRFGDLLFSDRIRELAAQLDSALFLDSEHFHRERERAEEEFRSAQVRPAAHAGVSYANEAEVLRDQLDGILRDREEQDADLPGGVLRGIIAPHIDITRGARGFGAAYRELGRISTASTFVVLGISHVPTRQRFVLTQKDFDTPLGLLPADREFIGELAARCEVDFFQDEFAHRNEHSVEFQALFLRYLFSDREDVRIVPVLCSLQDEIVTGKSPEEDPAFQDLAGVMRELLVERGERVCLIAGVDLSHVGRRFGQDLSLNSSLLKRIEMEDREMIERIIGVDAGEFFKGIAEEHDRRNVCGVPGIYTLLRLMDTPSGPPRGRLLHYGQAEDEKTQSVVTFMAAAFYG